MDRRQINHQHGHLRGEEPSQSIHPLQLLNLLLDSGLEIGVPLGQFSRLPGNGVVVLLDPSQRGDTRQQLAPVDGLVDEIVSR